MATYNRFTIAKPDEKKAVTTANRFTVNPVVAPAPTPAPATAPTPAPVVAPARPQIDSTRPITQTDTASPQATWGDGKPVYKNPAPVDTRSYVKPEPEKAPYSFMENIKPLEIKVPQAVTDFMNPLKVDYQKRDAAILAAAERQREAMKPLEDLVRKPLEKLWGAVEYTKDAPLRIMNHPAVAPVMAEVAKRTSGTGIVSMVQAIGPKTFDEAYQANRKAQAGDPSKLNQFLYQLGDTVPQTALGVALNFVPYAGRPLSTAYWTALSASEQIENKGSVTSLGNIGIDVLGDRMLGNSIEALFKAPAKSLASTVVKNFAVEGGTEVSQDLLKMQNDYNNAKTPEEKAKIVENAKEYFTSGQILMTAGVGGLTGAGLGTAAYTVNQTDKLLSEMTPGQKQAGFIANPFASKESAEKATEQTLSPSDSAQQTIDFAKQSYAPEIAASIEPLEQVAEGEKRTPLNERVRWIDYLRTPWRVFERMGIKQNYIELLKGYTNYVIELPKNIDKITAWSKQVAPESNERIFRALDGEKIELNPQETKVAGEIKTWLSEWADRLGMKADERISSYITHIFPLGSKGEIPEEIAYLINKKIPGQVYDPYLLERAGAEGYIKDTWKALDAYVKRATRKVNMDPALALLDERVNKGENKLTDTSQLNYINRWIGAVNLRPTELDTSIDNHIKEKFGYIFGVRPTSSLTRQARQMIARAKIGGSVTSFAKNLTQGVNTFSELGTRYTVRGYMDLVKFGGKELQEQGVLIAPFVEDQTYSAIKKFAEKFDKVLFLNMNASELVNRGAAYYGAKAKYLNGDITPKEIKKALNKDMPADYTPTMEDAIAYGKFVSAKTQFVFGPLDTPVALNSDIAKTFAQFQTFGLKQAEFIGSMVHEREWLKLFRYLLSSMLLFTYIGGAFGMKWDDSFKVLRWGYPPIVQFFIDIWGQGIIGEDKYGNKLTPGERVKSVGKSLFTNVVPAGAQIMRGAEGFQAVNAGKSTTKSGTFQYKIDQTPMNYIKGTLFGKYNLPEAKAYTKSKEDKTKSGTPRKRF